MGRGLIDSARVSKADGSQSLEVPAERGAVLRRAAEEFEQRVFLSTLNDIRNFCEAYGIEEPRSKSRASEIPRVFKFLVTWTWQMWRGCWMTGCSPDRPSSAPSQTPSEVRRRNIATRRLITAERLLP